MVSPLEAGDTAKARRLTLQHIGNVEQALQVDASADPAADPTPACHIGAGSTAGQLR